MAESDKREAPASEAAPALADLAHQVVETRNQMIKLANSVASLSAEVREVGRAYEAGRRRTLLNSAAAYVLFVVLVATGFTLAYRSRLDRVDFERDTIVREHAAVLSKLEGLRQAVERRRESDNKAAAFYRLSQSGQVQQALHRYPDVAQLPLSPVEAAVFQEWVSKTRSRLAYSAYAGGMKAFAEKHWKRAATEFQRSLTHLPAPPHEASLRYHYGISLARLGNYQEAALELERALAADAEKSVSPELRFHLGAIYEQLGRRDKARAAYAAYLKQHPATPLAAQARRKVAQLK